MLNKNLAVFKLKPFTFLVLSFILILVFANVFVVTGVSDSDMRTSANFKGKIKLIEGVLSLSYSSTEEELALVCSFKSSDKKYQLSINSQDRLGIIIIAEANNLTYSVEFLQPEQSWEPLKSFNNKHEYSRRAKLDQRPGWEIVVFEKISQIAA